MDPTLPPTLWQLSLSELTGIFLSFSFLNESVIKNVRCSEKSRYGRSLNDGIIAHFRTSLNTGFSKCRTYYFVRLLFSPEGRILSGRIHPITILSECSGTSDPASQ